MASEEFKNAFEVLGRDFANAGRVSTAIKDTLKGLGIQAPIVRRVAIASYEAEMNLVMYATPGEDATDGEFGSHHHRRRR